jgi:hypothetical protein
VSIMPKVIYDQLDHDSLVPTSMHMQLANQLIRCPVGIVEDIPVRIGNSFIPVDFVVLKMDVYRHIPLILGSPFLSTARATIDVAARIIKLNISRKEETFTFKPKGTKQCNQVMVTIRLERNAMTPDKKPSAAENFSMNFFDASRMPSLLRQVLQSHRQPKSSGMEMVLLTDLKCDALTGRINR